MPSQVADKVLWKYFEEPLVQSGL